MKQEDVLNKHKEIFHEWHSDEFDQMNSCMVWGLCVPDSWLPVVDWLCTRIDEMEGVSVVAGQVKEKFGGLRFYWNLAEGTDCDYAVISALVRTAEDLCDGIECGLIVWNEETR